LKGGGENPQKGKKKNHTQKCVDMVGGQHDLNPTTKRAYGNAKKRKERGRVHQFSSGQMGKVE